MLNRSFIRAHMRRFRVPLSQLANRQISFLHVYCQFSLDQIASQTNISRKTVNRILLGQRPTFGQLRKLQRTVLAATNELERLLPYARTRGRMDLYNEEIIRHLISLGRHLSRESKWNKP